MDFDIAEIGGVAHIRMWITLWTQDQPFHVQSVSFTGRNQTFTFSEVSKDSWIERSEEYPDEYRQDLLILFDAQGYNLLYDLYQIRQLMKADKAWQDFKVRVVLHGTEDIETELSDQLWPVFDVYWDLIQQSKAALDTGKVDGTPVVIE